MSKEEVLQQVIERVQSKDHKGYDPYDTLNSSLKFQSFGKWPPILAIQFQKRNPVNIRSLIGIKEDHNPKAMGLFLQSYSKLFKITGKTDYKKQADKIFDWLIENHTKGFSGLCWGYNFDWASPVKMTSAYSPTSVVTGFVSKGIREYYDIEKSNKAGEALTSIANFVMNDLPSIEDETGICISYATFYQDICYNASLLVVEALLNAQRVFRRR